MKVVWLSPNRYVVLKRKALVGAPSQKIKDTMAQFPADRELTNKTLKAFYQDLRTSAIKVEAADDQLRAYPNQSLAAHVLGYVRTVERGDAARDRWVDTEGVDGIERSVDAQLRGMRGWRSTEHDHSNQELVALRAQDVGGARRTQRGADH